MKNRKYFIVLLVIYLVMSSAGLILLFPSLSELIIDRFRYNGELLLMIFLFLIIVITVIIILLYLMLFKKGQEKEKESVQGYASNSMFSDERKYLEREIAILNQRLVSSEDRWNTAFHLLISSQNKQSNTNGAISTTEFLKGFGIDIYDVSIKRDLVFVITPFHPDFKPIYDCIKSACSELNMRAVRSDEELIGTDILKHIIKNIVEARVIVANLDGRNANVFYELGIAHALNKPTILLSKTEKNIPFDVQGKFMLLYNDDVSLIKNLKDSLTKILTSSM